jgi:hypothetical protein
MIFFSSKTIPIEGKLQFPMSSEPLPDDLTSSNIEVFFFCSRTIRYTYFKIYDYLIVWYLF